jgi:hypothetical protein
VYPEAPPAPAASVRGGRSSFLGRRCVEPYTVRTGVGPDAKISPSQTPLPVLDSPVIFWSYYCLGWANWCDFMKRMCRILANIAMVALLGMVTSPALSQVAATADLSKHRGAPGPLAGASLPVLPVSLWNLLVSEASHAN